MQRAFLGLFEGSLKPVALGAASGCDAGDPPDVIEPVLALLTAVSSRRHGQAAVVRALSRPQRAPASVSAF